MKLPADLVASLRPSYEGRRVCVTGGAGFIGGHTVDAIMSLGAAVTVIDDLSSSTAQHIADLIDLDPERIGFVHGSILDRSAMSKAIDRADIVIHLAAIGSVPRSVSDPQRTVAVNIDGTVAVLEAARAAKVRKFVFASSSSVYGGEGALGVARVEGMAMRSLSPYAASKAAGEALVSAWSSSYAMPAVCLRYFNVFGPRQPADSAYAAVIPAFLRSMLGSRPPVIFGDGAASRDFTFVSNAVAANLLAGVSRADLHGQAVNIGSGRAITVNQLASALASMCGMTHLHPRHEPARTGDVPHSLADITLAKGLLGFVPVTEFEKGLEETIAAYRKSLAAV